MSATNSTPTDASPGSYLPPPPQAIANSPTPQEQMNAGNAQFNALLKLISGGRARNRGRKSRRSKKHKRQQRGHSNKRYTKRRHRHRHRHRPRQRSLRRFGGTTTTALPLNPQKIEVSTVPSKGTEVAYPSSTDMQVKLAATISQNGANAALDSTTKSPA
jgi:hypothetical protein